MAFGAGAVGIAISVLIQAPQIALAVASRAEAEPGLAGMMAGLGYALTTIAYVPLVVMFAAVRMIAFRARAFPAWLGWPSAVAGAGYLMMSLGVVVDGGPLVPGAELTYVVLPIYVVWLIAITVVMIARLRAPATAAEIDC